MAASRERVGANSCPSGAETNRLADWPNNSVELVGKQAQLGPDLCGRGAGLAMGQGISLAVIWRADVRLVGAQNNWPGWARAPFLAIDYFPLYLIASRPDK